jgi:hypothetical protein
MSGLMDAFSSIESGGNPLAWNTLPGGRRSRYRGLFQFGPDMERRYGITDWTDVGQQQRAFGQHIGSLRTDLSRRLGRAPADWELYFGHQQGPSGSAALLSAAPGTPAWQAIRRFYGSDALAQQAITGNIPRGHRLAGLPVGSISAQDFAQLWQDRFGRAMGPGTGGPPTTAPAPLAMPVASSDSAPSPLTGGPPSDTGQSWLQRIGAGLTGALGAMNPVGSAQAQTPPIGGQDNGDGSRERPFSRSAIQQLGPSGVRAGMYYHRPDGALMVVERGPTGSWVGREVSSMSGPPGFRQGGPDGVTDTPSAPVAPPVGGPRSLQSGFGIRPVGDAFAGDWGAVLGPQTPPTPPPQPMYGSWVNAPESMTAPPVRPPGVSEAEFLQLLRGGNVEPSTLLGPLRPVSPLAPKRTLPGNAHLQVYDTPPMTPPTTPPTTPPVVPPFGAPVVTPEGGSYGHPMGQSELQPMGRDLVRESGLPPTPPPDADAIVRGAQAAADERTPTGGPPQRGWVEGLMQNPAFMAGLAILGTQPGGNWGPAGAQAATQAVRAGREQTEWERLQSRRSTMDRIWRDAFGANGSPNASHPLLQGVPPEMAQTIFAMGAEEGLPALQRWQMFRGQQAEQLRIQQAQEDATMRMFGIGGQTPPGGGGDGLEVATGDRLRAGAGLPGITDQSGITPPTPPVGGLQAPPPTGGPPPSTGPGGPPPGAPGGEAVVRIGNVSMTVSQARAFAAASRLPGVRQVVEQAITAAERQQQVPEAVRTRALQTDSAYRILAGALQDYTRLIEQTGVTMLPGQESDAVRLARTNILLQLKELYNLGVLNGPDLSLMESMVYDPSVGLTGMGPGGLVPGISGFSNLFTNPAERARAMSTRLLGELLRVRNNTATLAGLPPISAPSSGSSQSSPEGGFTIRRMD